VPLGTVVAAGEKTINGLASAGKGRVLLMQLQIRHLARLSAASLGAENTLLVQTNSVGPAGGLCGFRGSRRPRSNVRMHRWCKLHGGTGVGGGSGDVPLKAVVAAREKTID
jgi:hypothetical protein